MITNQRMLVWFSCGAPSACAAKECVERYSNSHEVVVVNCDTRPSEHGDNYRFSRDVESWIGRPIVYIRSEDYKDVDEVFEKTKYMSGIKGARCTTELKKIPRLRFSNPDDINVFGFTAEEGRRAKEFGLRNPDMILKWVLIEFGITKRECFRRLKSAGIKQPEMYDLGFENNNCPGCVKDTSKWYWDMIRRTFPDVFKRRCEQSRSIGCRLVRYNGSRIFLDELPPGPFKKPKRKEILSCGPECGIRTLLKF